MDQSDKIKITTNEWAEQINAAKKILGRNDKLSAAEIAQTLKERAKQIAVKKEEVKKDTEVLSVIEFDLGQEKYAVETQYLQEIYVSDNLYELPGTPDYIFGVINLRGKIISIINLKAYLQLNYVSGAGEMTILFRIVMPMLRPVLAVVAIHTCLINWNSFLFPFILTNTTSMRTLPVGVALLSQGAHSIDWGHLMAGAVISALPVVVAFVIFQRQIISGLTSGMGR